MRKLLIYPLLFILLYSFTISIGAFVTVQQQIKSDDLLKLRNLQYEQAKRIVRMQDLKSEFDKLNIEQQQISAEIDSWIKEQAKINNIDLTKSRWDSDKLKFVEIKKNE